MGNEVSLLWLLVTFFYIGMFTIGGGLVAITLMQQTIVDRGLISNEQFYNMIAISESTPGPVGVNMATFMGYKFYGIPGAIITSFAEVLPSLICILIIARFILRFRENRCVQTVFGVLRPAATGMIFVIAVNLFCNVLMFLPEDMDGMEDVVRRHAFSELFSWMNLCGYMLMFYLRHRFKWHPFFIVIFGALFGIIFM